MSLLDRLSSDLEEKLSQAGILVWYLGTHSGFDSRMFGRLGGVLREFQPHIVHTRLHVLRYLLPSLFLRWAGAWIHRRKGWMGESGAFPAFPRGWRSRTG